MSIWQRFWRWLRPQPRQAQPIAAHPCEPPAAAIPTPEAPPCDPPTPKPPAVVAGNRPRKQTARLKTDVLNQLGRYQTYIRRLKRWDPEAFALYRRIGAFIIPRDSTRRSAVLIDRKQMEPIFYKNLPGFGAIAVTMSSEDEKNLDKFIPVRFAYFVKLKRPGYDVERVNAGTTYRLHVYWDDKRDNRPECAGERQWQARGHGFGTDYLINVAPDGMIRALRVLKSKAQVIRHRNGHNSTVEHQRWGLPHLPGPGDPAESIRNLFILLMNWWIMAAYHSMIRITATKDNVVMPFIVDATATPQFFADRDPIVVDGVKKRIFHIVRPHQRQTATGAKAIRMHFAGLRSFAWNGYDIAITVPGRDHFDVAQFNVGMLEDLPEEEREGTMNPGELGEWLADAIQAPGKEQAA